MDPRRLDLRRQLAYHRHGWAPPGSQGSSGSVTPSRRGPLVARASLLRGGVSDIRKKEDALVKIRDAEAMYRLVNVSQSGADGEHERSCRRRVLDLVNLALTINPHRPRPFPLTTRSARRWITLDVSSASFETSPPATTSNSQTCASRSSTRLPLPSRRAYSP